MILKELTSLIYRMKKLLSVLMCIPLLAMSACTVSDELENTDQELGKFDLETKSVLLNSGYEMPVMGLGTYSLSDEECYNSVSALLRAGGRLIDTAYMYHNEASVGRAVRESGVPREEVFVITKIYTSQF